MNIEFDNKALEELYLKGETSDKKYRKLSKDVVNILKQLIISRQ